MRAARVHPTISEAQEKTMAWFEPVTRTDKYTIASRIALAGLEGFKGTLTAAQQRTLFGRYIFGKMYLELDCTNGGIVKGYRKVCFGTDWEDYSLTFDEVAEISNHKEKSFSIAGRSFKRNK